ncbi:MAG TPA: quinone oxidoreductase [bacterium]|nr:quinone oxidoreductase [bacterium]
MKAIRVHAPGGPDALRYEDVPPPSPGRTDLLVRLAAIGVNFIDVHHRAGTRGAAFPLIPGVEGAGTVEAIGSEVADVAVGDRVVYAGPLGAYAEYAAIPASLAVKLPDEVEFPAAAATFLVGMTAHFLTHSLLPLEAGDAVLVHAAAGGLGHVLVQVASLRGARVLGTASTPEKAEVARGCGAEQVLPYAQFDREARRLTGGQGVVAVYDSVGAATFSRSLDCLASRGWLVLLGESSGAVPPVDPRILTEKGSLVLARPTLADYVRTRVELLHRARDVLEWIVAKRIRVHVDAVYPLEKAREAHARLARRQSIGKILLVPG